MSISEAAAQGAPRANRAVNENPDVDFEVTPGGLDIKRFTTHKVIDRKAYPNAFDRVVELAGLDSDDYEIVDNTVRFKGSVWDQSARSTSGDRDKITLESFQYSASFRRKSIVDIRTERLVEELAQQTRPWKKKPKKSASARLNPECTFVVMVSAPPTGKREIREADISAYGETGPEQTTGRIMRDLEASYVRIKELRRIGRNGTGVAMCFMGDMIEGAADSYESQTYSVVLNQTQQENLALRWAVKYARELLPMADDQAKAHLLSVICNHGQKSRRGTKSNVTSDDDNFGTQMIETMREHIIGPQMPDIQWHIPGADMVVLATFSDVQIAATHGHKMSGREDKWFQGQQVALAATKGHHPRLWLTGHRHHQSVTDFGALHRIQGASTDGGSKWLFDNTGIYSTPGTTTLLVGQHDERGFSDVELL